MLPLRDKTLALPPSLKVIEAIQNLGEHVVSELDSRFRYAVEKVEIDHGFKIYLAYNFFGDNNLCMVWSQLSDFMT